MMRKSLGALAILALLSGAWALSSTPGQAAPPQDKASAADSCVRTLVWDAYPEGWAVRTISSVQLAEMEHKIYMLTLYSGNEYRLIACGDESVQNTDLVLYDADGRLLRQDQDSSRRAVLTFKPESTDTYYVALHATELTEQARKAGKRAQLSFAVTYR